MKKSTQNKSLKLTNNEKKVLRKIIEEGRIADTDMAKSLKISQQGIFRIRRKLEDSGIIEGYYPNINFKKIGINLIQVLGVKLNPIVWKTKKEPEIALQFRKIPYVFHAYRITGYDITYMLTLGFKDIHQKDRFLKKLETLFIDQMEIKWSYNFSVENIITLDPLSLLYESINDKDYSFDKLF
jgi:DNA-binding Lrp family transcriptional regulator